MMAIQIKVHLVDRLESGLVFLVLLCDSLCWLCDAGSRYDPKDVGWESSLSMFSNVPSDDNTIAHSVKNCIGWFQLPDTWY